MTSPVPPDVAVNPEPGPVSLQLCPPVAVVQLADAAHSNRITAALRTALPAAMRKAAAAPDIRALLLTGLPGVFCAGGTKEDLTADGGARTSDGWGFVRAPADCPLPVVAAAQGHAIGGGLLLALYADMAVFSDRSCYAASFLSLGFTPCLGATHVIPSRLGTVLGQEMLYSGRPYRGRELAGRGAGVLVIPHDQVMAKALALAQRIAQAPRTSLIHLKRLLAAADRERATAAFHRELEDHRATLASPEVQHRIAALYPGP